MTGRNQTINPEKIPNHPPGTFQYLVGPTEAKEILMWHNNGNRKISQAHVARYAIDMENNNFPYNGVPIIFSKKGKIIDGQHRLQAKSQVSGKILFSFVFGMDESIAATIDCGKQRSSMDCVKMAFNDEYTTRQISSAISAVRAIYVYLCKIPAKRLGGFGKTDPVTTLNFLKEYEQILAYTKIWSKFQKKGNIRLRLDVVAAVFFIVSCNWHKKLSDLVQKIYTGENISRRDPAHKARMAIIEMPNKTEIPIFYHHLHAVTIAWNNTVKSKTGHCKQYSVRPGEYIPLKMQYNFCDEIYNALGIPRSVC